MIKPISFDNNPFILPKAAQYTRFYGNKNFTNNNPRPHTSQAHDNDGFEMKSARKVSDVAEPVEKHERKQSDVAETKPAEKRVQFKPGMVKEEPKPAKEEFEKVEDKRKKVAQRA